MKTIGEMCKELKDVWDSTKIDFPDVDTMTRALLTKELWKKRYNGPIVSYSGSQTSLGKQNETVTELATTKQRNYMDRLKINYTSNISKREASKLIDEKVKG